MHPLTISVTHLHHLFYHRGGSQGILRFNYFYIKFEWQMLKTFSALVDCLNTIPQASTEITFINYRMTSLINCHIIAYTFFSLAIPFSYLTDPGV